MTLTRTRLVAILAALLMIVLLLPSAALADPQFDVDPNHTEVPPTYYSNLSVFSGDDGLGRNPATADEIVAVFANLLDDIIGTRWRTEHGTYTSCSQGGASSNICALHRTGIIQPFYWGTNYDPDQTVDRRRLAWMVDNLRVFINQHNGSSSFTSDPHRQDSSSPHAAGLVDMPGVPTSDPNWTDWRDVKEDYDNGHPGISSYHASMYLNGVTRGAAPGVRILEPCAPTVEGQVQYADQRNQNTDAPLGEPPSIRGPDFCPTHDLTKDELIMTAYRTYCSATAPAAPSEVWDDVVGNRVIGKKCWEMYWYNYDGQGFTPPGGPGGYLGDLLPGLPARSIRR